MSNHIERMKKEHNELKDRLTALNSFIEHNDLFKKLDPCEQVRMIKQAAFMESYLDILHARLRVAHGNS